MNQKKESSWTDSKKTPWTKDQSSSQKANTTPKVEQKIYDVVERDNRDII